MTGKLILCPTPLGNLGDMPPRAREALRSADAICAEDTRITGKLLAALGIEGKRLERLDENVIADRAPALMERIAAGETIVYCTDAGMPGISDPGMRLVRTARDEALPVEVLPGPTAVATAYVASGTLCPCFYFGGFFPRKDAARQALLQSLAPLDAALIFYESPNRLVSALESIAATVPLRRVTVCRELTKLHEEILSGTAQDLAAIFGERPQVKGEIVLVIDGAPDAEHATAAAAAAEDAAVFARKALDDGERPKDVAKAMAERFAISRNEAYDLVLSLKDEGKPSGASPLGDL